MHAAVEAASAAGGAAVVVQARGRTTQLTREGRRGGTLGGGSPTHGDTLARGVLVLQREGQMRRGTGGIGGRVPAFSE